MSLVGKMLEALSAKKDPNYRILTCSNGLNQL